MTSAPDALHVISLTAAFATGLAGSGHCFGMCGGMAAAYGGKARRDVEGSPNQPARAFVQVALYHVGRLGGYALLGAIAGAAGSLLLGAFDLLRLATILRILTGALIVVMGVRLLAGLAGLGFLEKGGARLWRHLAPVARRLAAGNGTAAALGAGLIWGWLPCGLVYSMLALAAATATPVVGSATLLAFGLGTLPAMLTSGLMASQLSRILKSPRARPLAGVALVICGVWTVIAAQGHSHAVAGEHSQTGAIHVHSTP
ncbi:MAG: sulfite exporter TauE/SafE family protein [Steroidobacteraceae bacterium]